MPEPKTITDPKECELARRACAVKLARTSMSGFPLQDPDITIDTDSPVTMDSYGNYVIKVTVLVHRGYAR